EARDHEEDRDADVEAGRERAERIAADVEPADERGVRDRDHGGGHGAQPVERGEPRTAGGLDRRGLLLAQFHEATSAFATGARSPRRRNRLGIPIGRGRYCLASTVLARLLGLRRAPGT